ncbi:MAG: two-component regulator propeller domain-containing protein [Myxococcales bacterium]
MRKGTGLLAGAVAVAAAVALARCGSSERIVPPPPDAGTGGTGTEPADAGGAGAQDAGGSDAGAADGGATDGGASDAGPATIAPPVLATPAQADVQRFPGPALFGASMDEGGNLWGVSTDALWLWRSGGKGWEKFDNHKSGGVLGNGHANDGLLSVAGGAPGEAWIGYRGLFLNGDEEDDPSIVSEAIRTSGGADRVSAVPGGLALRDHLVFWTGPGILAAEPKGRWKVRSIWSILYNHGPHGIPGDVFFGGNHGIGMFRQRIQAMDEHAHAAWNFCPASMYPECSLMTGDHKGIAIAADGNVWMGADFAAERLSYMDQPGGDLYAWVDNDVDVPKPDGLRLWVNRSNDTQHPEWGGRDFVTAMAFDAWGDLWVSSYMNGVARLPMKGSFSAASSWSEVEYWSHRRGDKVPGWTDRSDNVWSLVADPDGSIWVGGPQGAFRFVGRTGQWISYGGAIPGPSVNQISLDPRPGSRGVVFATDSGAFVYTGK